MGMIEYDPAQDEVVIAHTIAAYKRMSPVSEGMPLDWPDWANLAMNELRVERGYPVFEIIAPKMFEVGAIARRMYEQASQPKGC